MTSDPIVTSDTISQKLEKVSKLYKKITEKKKPKEKKPKETKDESKKEEGHDKKEQNQSEEEFVDL